MKIKNVKETHQSQANKCCNANLIYRPVKNKSIVTSILTYNLIDDNRNFTSTV